MSKFRDSLTNTVLRLFPEIGLEVAKFIRVTSMVDPQREVIGL